MVNFMCKKSTQTQQKTQIIKKVAKLSFKDMVAKKLQLEKEDNIDTTEYKTNNKNIDEFLSNLSQNDRKYLKNVCNQDYQNYVNFYNSDIEDAQRKQMDAKMDAVLACSDLLNKKLVKKEADTHLEV